MVNSYLRLYLAVLWLRSFRPITEPLYLRWQKRSPLSPLSNCKRFHKQGVHLDIKAILAVPSRKKSMWNADSTTTVHSEVKMWQVQSVWSQHRHDRTNASFRGTSAFFGILLTTCVHASPDQLRTPTLNDHDLRVVEMHAFLIPCLWQY